MNTSTTRSAALILLVFATAVLSGMRDDGRRPRGVRADGDGPAAGCSGRGGSDDPGNGTGRGGVEGEGRRGSAGRGRVRAGRADAIPEVVVQARIRLRHEAIDDLVTEAQTLLRDVELQYVLTGKGKRQTLRGRPVAFALWSEVKQEWTIAQAGTAASAGQVETRQEATALPLPHAWNRGAAREGHRRRAADVLLLQGWRALEGVWAQVPGVRQQPGEAQDSGPPSSRPPSPSSIYLSRKTPSIRLSSAAARTSWSPPPARRSKSCGSRMHRARPFRANCSPTPFPCRSSRRLP